MASHAFLSYVRDDADLVARLVKDLRARGVDVWRDRDQIEPGARWKDAIRRAIQEGSFYIACFSQRSKQRERSYMNEELLLAIEELRQRPSSRAWFIPVVFDGGEVPDLPIGAGQTLCDIQWVDLTADWQRGVVAISTLILGTRARPLRPHSAKQLRLAAEAREQRVAQRRLLLPLAEKLEQLSLAKMPSQIAHDIAPDLSVIVPLSIFGAHHYQPKVPSIRVKIAEYVEALKQCHAVAVSTYPTVSDVPLRIIVKDVELALSGLVQASIAYDAVLQGFLSDKGNVLALLRISPLQLRAPEEKLKVATTLFLQYSKAPSTPVTPPLPR